MRRLVPTAAVPTSPHRGCDLRLGVGGAGIFKINFTSGSGMLLSL